MSEHKPKYLGIFFVLMTVSICVLFLGFSWLSNQPPFSDDYNAIKTTSVVSACSYSWAVDQTSVYLNNGLHLHYIGSIELLVGGNYTITYRQDSLRILSLKLLDGD